MAELALTTTDQLFVTFNTVKFKEKLTQIIPETLRPDRMIQLAVTLIKNSEALMRCRPITLYACVVECALLGLELDNVLGHAYLVPFKETCQLIVGYRGFCHLAYQSGQVASISAEVVRPRDKFQVQLGTERRLIHVPIDNTKRDDPDQWKGAYAVGKQTNGTTQFEWMDRSKIEASRSRSQSWRAFLKDPEKQTPWATDPEEMWRKTPIRRLAKLLPRSTTDKRQLLLRAAMLDEYGERGLLEATPEGLVPRQGDVIEVQEDFLPTTSTEDLVPKLKESIAVVDAKKDKPGREKKKPPKDRPTWESTHCPHCGVSMADLDPKTSGAIHLTGKCKEKAPKEKTTGPPSAVIPANGAPNKIDDPFLTSQQQTEIFNAGFQNHWQVPEGLNEMFKKHFKAANIRELRNSQFAAVLQRVKKLN